MDTETREEIDELRARIVALESVLGDMRDVEEEPGVSVVEQHREFAAYVKARREAG